MTTLLVDFNMRRGDGLIPALVSPTDSSQLTPGTRVTAADGEGTECVAVVDEIVRDGRIALLNPVGGSWRRDSEIRPARGVLA